MNQHIIAYANTLSVIVLAQSLKIAQLKQQLDADTEALERLSRATKALMDATFGKIEVFEMEG